MRAEIILEEALREKKRHDKFLVFCNKVGLVPTKELWEAYKVAEAHTNDHS